MNSKEVMILDSTLRDGAQAEGISFSVEDKLSIIKALDSLGIGYIEAGNPASNPKEAELFNRLSSLNLKNSRIVAFGSTRKKNTKTDEDLGLKALLLAKTQYVSVVGKCSPLHVEKVLKTDKEENRRMIYDTVAYLKSKGKTVFFDAEHFFDAYNADKDYALSALKAADTAGADALILCDTNGGMFPDEVSRITEELCLIFPQKIGVHLHNDRGMAVAGSVMAAKSGAVMIQGTLLGFGERCGNANLSTIIPNLQLAAGIKCIDDANLKQITQTSRAVAEISNISVKQNEPYIGRSAFAHKAGMHADGVVKLPLSFEHTEPESVGNERRILVSEHSGKTAVYEKIALLFPGIEKGSEILGTVLKNLKEMEKNGYQFEGAEASFEMLIRRSMGGLDHFFKLINYKIMSSRPCEQDLSATATVKVEVSGKAKVMAAEGIGPINALDKALRMALEVFYPSLCSVHLIDYKVRVLDPDSATAASVRVLITSTDGARVWTTVGVSGDVVEASRIALTESIEYFLYKDTGE